MAFKQSDPPGESAVLMQADMLFRTERFHEAENILRNWLMCSSSHSAAVQAVLSQAISQQPGRYLEALDEARRSIEQAPDAPIGYYMLALIQSDGDPKAALSALEEALRLAPDRPAFYALQARIYLRMKQPKRALEAIQIARQLAPENVECIQIHATALLHNRQTRQAREVLDMGLHLDPLDATVHNAMGWALLGLGESSLARMHFREALRQKPKFANARDGLMHALKARYPFYRWILGYFNWQQAQPRLVRYLFIIFNSLCSIFLVGSIMLGLALVNPNLIWLFMPLLLVLALTVVMPLLSTPLFDLFLRFDADNRLYLTRGQIWFTNWIIAIFICTGASVVQLYLNNSLLDSLGVYFLSVVVAGFIVGFWPAMKN